MLRIAVTGGIACGKSLVGAYLREQGVAVTDSDALGHALLASDEATYEAVLAAFGEEILDGESRIDRARLGRVVFSEPARRLDLNGILHPRIRAAWEAWLAEQAGRVSMAAVQIPLLFEARLAGCWDAVICVAATERNQMARLRARGLTARAARQRLAAQLPVRAKMACADYVVCNDGTKELAAKQVKLILSHIAETS